MNKNNKIKTIVIFSLSYTCILGTPHAQNSEKAFIKENMNFAAKQYWLMLKTPMQGKNEKGVMPYSIKRMELYPREVFIGGLRASSPVPCGICPNIWTMRLCRTPRWCTPARWSRRNRSRTTTTSAS